MSSIESVMDLAYSLTMMIDKRHAMIAIHIIVFDGKGAATVTLLAGVQQPVARRCWHTYQAVGKRCGRSSRRRSGRRRRSGAQGPGDANQRPGRSSTRYPPGYWSCS